MIKNYNNKNDQLIIGLAISTKHMMSKFCIRMCFFILNSTNIQNSSPTVNKYLLLIYCIINLSCVRDLFLILRFSVLLQMCSQLMLSIYYLQECYLHLNIVSAWSALFILIMFSSTVYFWSFVINVI